MHEAKVTGSCSSGRHTEHPKAENDSISAGPFHHKARVRSTRLLKRRKIVVPLWPYTHVVQGFTVAPDSFPPILTRLPS